MPLLCPQVVCQLPPRQIKSIYVAPTPPVPKRFAHKCMHEDSYGRQYAMLLGY